MVKYMKEICHGGIVLGKVKLIATDLDGTFLTDDKHISQNNMKALKAAVEKGVLFVPATGRGLFTMPESVMELDCFRYIITSNGAAIEDMKDKRTIYKKQLDSDLTRDIIKYGLDLGIMVEIFIDGRAYTLEKFNKDLVGYGVNPKFVNWLRDTRTMVESFDNILKNDTTVENINLIFTDMNQRVETYNYILEKYNVEITNSIGNNLEIGAKGCSKGEALEFLAGLLGINMSEVMCLGDNDNDRDMIRRSGIGIAVKNADEKLKNSAGYIVSSNNEDGFAEAVERFVLD